MELADRFMQEVNLLLEDKELEIDILSKTVAKNFLTSFYKAAKQDPEATKQVLAKIKNSLEKILKDENKSK